MCGDGGSSIRPNMHILSGFFMYCINYDKQASFLNNSHKPRAQTYSYDIRFEVIVSYVEINTFQ